MKDLQKLTEGEKNNKRDFSVIYLEKVQKISH